MKQKIEKHPKRTEQLFKIVTAAMIFCLCFGFPSYATQQITNGIKNIYNLLVSIVAAIGGIAVIWGIFELAISFQQHDTSRTTEGIKKIVAGLIMCFGSAVVALLGVTM